MPNAVKLFINHRTQRIREGHWYVFISDIGTHIEDERKKRYDAFVRQQQEANVPAKAISDEQLKLRCSLFRPKGFFETGGNAQQTEATAAYNAGCGFILITDKLKVVFQ